MFDLGRTLIAAARRNPEAMAIVDGDRRFAYEEWLRIVTTLALALRDRALSPGDRLMTCLQNRWEAAALHWACQMIGVTVTPVNWRVKADELAFLIADAGPALIVYESVTRSAVGEAAPGRPGIFVGRHRPADATAFSDLLANGKTGPDLTADPDDISVMFYTSGTTGRGKGVPRSHRIERAAAIAHVAQNSYGPGESILGVMPLYHTMGVRALLAMALVSGCFVCLPRFDAKAALGLIARERITSLYLVPTLYHDLLAHEDNRRADLGSVRKLGFAGAAMTDDLLRRLDERFAPDLLVNHYGASEIYTLTVCRDAAAKPGSAGKAGLNQEVRVVALGAQDPEARVARGENGQIIARLDGDEAFAGYWNRPDADARSLRGGWYFTGDTGFQDSVGDLFVTGRVDDMIITGGENVFPSEIESVLSGHPEVTEVAVAGLPDPRWGQQVTAFILRGGSVAAADLDRWCRDTGLADFKRPRRYRFVKAIPKSPVGKILRRRLIAGDYEDEPEA